jgi:L-iditol 2-dehydrogenase
MSGTMRAAVLYGQEDVRLESVPMPAVGRGEVLMRVEAALTCGTDAKVFRRGYHARMIRPPAVFGHEAAGVIVAVGDGVKDFAPGMSVVPANSAPCGSCEYCRLDRPALCEDLLFWNGAYAEYALLPARIVEKNLLRLPEGLSHHKAALVEPLACAVRGVEDCHVESGQSVAILGAGPLGLMLLQVAHRRGAHVVVAGRSPERLGLARRLGAADVVSSQAGDLVTQLREKSPAGRGFPVVVEAVGKPETSRMALACARKGGVVNLFGGCAAGSELIVDLQHFHYDELALVATFHHTPGSIREALGLIVEGAIDADDYIAGEAALDQLPGVLAEIATGRRPLKTLIRPQGTK